ncbi:MAG: hypothetical protein GY696_35060 [Gammaproteobacteria bacterium]|nr:hypothetical protein [Gammaproteobacteria bacterium]
MSLFGFICMVILILRDCCRKKPSEAEAASTEHLTTLPPPTPHALYRSQMRRQPVQQSAAGAVSSQHPTPTLYRTPPHSLYRNRCLTPSHLIYLSYDPLLLKQRDSLLL